MSPAAEELVRRHVAAVNAGDVEGVLSTLAPDAVWTTGQDRFVGASEIRPFFADALPAVRPDLEIEHLASADDVVMVELIERLVHDGVRRTFPIVAVFEIRGDWITDARIYREGSADL